MKEFSLYHLLEFPQVFSLVQKLLAPGSELLLKKQFEDIFDKSKGLILDVGCGPLSAASLPNSIIVGVDTNLLYVKRYLCIDVKQNGGHRTHFGFVCCADALPFGNNIFDESRCMGLLHHLSKESALSTIKEMLRCTRAKGRLIIFDSVWPEVAIYRPIAWLTCRFDRGKWMLNEEQLLELANTAYSGDWQYRRFTYTYTGLEGLLLTVQKTG